MTHPAEPSPAFRPESTPRRAMHRQQHIARDVTFSIAENFPHCATVVITSLPVAVLDERLLGQSESLPLLLRLEFIRVGLLRTRLTRGLVMTSSKRAFGFARSASISALIFSASAAWLRSADGAPTFFDLICRALIFSISVWPPSSRRGVEGIPIWLPFTLAFLATLLVECNSVTIRKLLKKLRRRHHRSSGPSRIREVCAELLT